MIAPFDAHPGRLFVIAAVLPLASAALLAIAGTVRNLCRPFRHAGGFAGGTVGFGVGSPPATMRGVAAGTDGSVVSSVESGFF